MTGSYEAILFNGQRKRISKNSRVIDPEKFKKIMKEKHISFTEAALQIGYASNSVSSALQTGYFNNIMIKGLETHYGIKYEDYAFIPAPEKPKEEPEQELSHSKGHDMAELYNVIKAAIVDGMNEAIAGNMKNLRGGIYAAIYQAVNAVKKEG